MTTEELDVEFLKIVQKEISYISTLNARNLDSVDFYDIHIRTLHKMLHQAYKLGRKEGTPL